MSDDKYARFLTGHTTARWLVQSEGLGNVANELVPVLYSLQNAHDRIVNREARLMAFKLLRWLRAGKVKAGMVSQEQLADLFGVSRAILRELEQKLVGDNQAKRAQKVDVVSPATATGNPEDSANQQNLRVPCSQGS